jgi:hypothetical protein
MGAVLVVLLHAEAELQPVLHLSNIISNPPSKSEQADRESGYDPE